MSRTRRAVPKLRSAFAPRYAERIARGLADMPIRSLEPFGEVWDPKAKRIVKTTRSRQDRRAARRVCRATEE